MGGSSLTALGLKAMTANYIGLQTTSHNIGNANVAGYSRQDAQFATSKALLVGGLYQGRGVDVATIERAHNEFATREAASSKALSTMDAARLEQLQQIEPVFKPGEGGLGNAVSDLMGALSDMASQPGDLATREVVLARADSLAARFRDAGALFDQSQATVTGALEAAVSEINSLALSIAADNQQIAAAQNVGQPANDLLDERDRLISRLATHLKLSTVLANDGSLSVFIAGGQRLVLGSEAGELAVMQDSSDPTRSALGIMEGGSPRMIAPDAVGGGSVAGLLRFQNLDLAAARQSLGDMAAGLASAFNIQHGQGQTLNGGAGGDLFATLGNPPDPKGMALLITDPRELAAAAMTAPSGALATSNDNALALAGLRDQTILGGRTIDDAWAQLTAEFGARIQNAQAAADISASVAAQTESTRASLAGVNLDEEAAKLIQYQQSYQAAAKILQVAQVLFDKMLEATTR
ncbi:Flagellar hook-associated protein flgK [Rubrivivax sp. A210]|uniref:flagellar hook-associated protein FlgK n=1 Tax=Rubrivivax sp. A210 TaxID=2772301 RepID=UPI00191AAC90|nr:flagellar hook-associated protein FlgK [Rubrivivax sp. A210]CAD5374740.1 Flagellar hook-associated protein flgK [Rubrivivax sp. A210]